MRRGPWTTCKGQQRLETPKPHTLTPVSVFNDQSWMGIPECGGMFAWS